MSQRHAAAPGDDLIHRREHLEGVRGPGLSFHVEASTREANSDL